MMPAALRVPARCVALAGLVLAIAPLQALRLAFGAPRGIGRLPPLFHRAFAAILGVRASVAGAPGPAVGTVYVANHLSYLDVSVLGSLLRARFVAKEDVARWPVFGALARLQRTLFVSRAATRAAGVVSAMEAAIAAGDALILFPEGTTSAGDRVLPFKSSAFAALAGAPVRIQPVTLLLQSVDGYPVERGPGPRRDAYAYHGDMVLAPHLLAFMRTRGARLQVVFHAPIDAAHWRDRKALAREAWQRVDAGLQGGWQDAPIPGDAGEAASA